MSYIQNNKTLILGIITYSFISLLIVFYNHHYYDDEIFNLSKMSWGIGEIFTYIQGEDVHPPLSYLINKILFDIFSSYKAILIFSIILNVSALGYFYKFSEKKLDDNYSKILLFILVFLNGGLLLWTNSVRWYAYWVPLFVILYTYLLKYQTLNIKNIVVISLLLVVMTYINYLTFLLLISLAVYFIVWRRHDISFKNIVLFSLIYFSLSAYQIFVFLTVHMQNKASQVSSLLNSVLNAIYGVINGGSVFIADPLFLLYAIATLFIIAVGFKNAYIQKKENPLLWQSIGLLTVMITLMVIIGVSGKYRNNIALSIPFYFIIAYIFSYIKNINIKRAYIVIALLLSIISTFNLVTHTNTSKNSYNMPISILDKLLSNSENKLLVTYDPTTYFYFSGKGYKIYYLLENQESMSISQDTDVYLVKTYQGALSNEKYKKVLSLYKIISNEMDDEKTDKIGTDKYSNIKNKLPGDRPEIDSVQMFVVHGTIVSDLKLPKWHDDIESK